VSGGALADSVTTGRIRFPDGSSITSVAPTPVAATLAAGVTNYSATYPSFNHRRDAHGTVYLSGLVTCSGCAGDMGGFLLTTLPAGFRPEKVEIFAIHHTGTTQRLDVHPNGKVVLMTNTGPGGYTSVSGASFRAVQ
jgi:hypothetical protein